MEMEDHHYHHHHHEQPQYTITDLRQLVNGPRSSHFPSLPSQPTAELFPGGHPNLAGSHHQHYEMMMFGRQVPDIMPRCLHDFASTDSTAAATNTNIAVATPTTTSAVSTPPLSGLEAETAGCLGLDASTGRWPRQETLTLLEIRSRLDPKFKEANQKGPLWDEVSRIMSEEHGYQRSGKKCREKFENLYKYYKKTKEGKAGRQDGKHYRFFRQLEALYGESSNTNPTSLPETSTLRFHTPTSHPHNPEPFHSHSLSLTNSTDFDTSSSGGNEEVELEKRRSKSSGRNWKTKIKSFIDSQMRKLVEKQEEWLEKLTKTLEDKEKERIIREEEWRRQEAVRIEREHKFWAKERAWIEARDAALMEALQKLTGSEINNNNKSMTMTGGIIQNNKETSNNQNEDGSGILNSRESWAESEITRLVQLKAEMMETSGCSSEEAMWDEIANKMACYGYERSALIFKEKWESMSNYKKRKQNSRGCFYFENSGDALYNHQGGAYCNVNDQRQESGIGRLHSNNGSSPSNSNVGNESCFPFLISEGGNLWENYGLKVKTNQNQ